MGSKFLKKRVYVDANGNEHRCNYPHFSIVGYCNTRKMEMFFNKIDKNRNGHFVYLPIYAMQFEEEVDAQAIIKAFNLKNCSVKPMYCEENANIYPSTRIASFNEE